MYYNPYDVANSPNNYNYTSRKCSRAVAMAVLLFHAILFPVTSTPCKKCVSRPTETELQKHALPHSHLKTLLCQVMAQVRLVLV